VHPCLTASSGLPGPRGNLELAGAFVAIADRARVRPEPYRSLAMCTAHPCWSVAVAADPDEGTASDRLRTVDDPDIRWIVASNLKKFRLRRHLER